MEDQNAALIEECEKYDIPVFKKNGQMYGEQTLLKKLKKASEMLGGAKEDTPTEDEVLDLIRIPRYSEDTEGNDRAETGKGEDVVVPEDILGERFDEGFPSVSGLASKRAKTSKASKASKAWKASGQQISDNPLGPVQDYHVDYKQGPQSAILEDPLIQAYFHRLGVTKINDDSEIPVGLVMALYGNHAQLGSSGLSKQLPNILENPDIQEYWDSKGIKKVSPQTMLPVKWIYLTN